MLNNHSEYKQSFEVTFITFDVRSLDGPWPTTQCIENFGHTYINILGICLEDKILKL